MYPVTAVIHWIFKKILHVFFPQSSFSSFPPAAAAIYLREREFFAVTHTPNCFPLYKIPVQLMMCVACLAVSAQLVPIYSQLAAVGELSLQTTWFIFTLGWVFLKFPLGG